MSEQNLVVEYEHQYGQARGRVRIEGLLPTQVGCVVEWLHDNTKQFPRLEKQLHQQKTEQPSVMSISESDDSSEPITEEWLETCVFKNHENAVWGVFCENDGRYYATPQGEIELFTRRDVRILCELLRVELKEAV